MTPDAPLRLVDSLDWPAIAAICDAAFGQPAETGLVRRLAQDGDLVLALTAFGPEPVGHIAFSRLTLDGHPDFRAAALAPVAVVPARQGRGVGALLVREGLRRLAETGCDLVLVLGEPDYYGRFGFDAEAARRFETPYDGPYLQALALTERGREAQGPVAYAPAFAGLT